MLLLTNVAEVCSFLTEYRQQKIGLVPTMGALHQGHGSLIEKAIAENDFVVVSIFVNPLQFSPSEDLSRYPRQLELDCQFCRELGVGAVFCPSAQELGIGENDNSLNSNRVAVSPPETMLSVLCGRFRPGHFTGVATIVTKLFNIVQPSNAYFGEKDFQQLAVIRRLVKDLNFSVNIRGCAIVREKSGLALSSRNKYLSTTEKEQSLGLSRALFKARGAFWQGERDTSRLIEIVFKELAAVEAIKIQYVELVEVDTLEPLTKVDQKGLLAIACYIGSTRLIDNVILEQRKPIVAIDGPAGAGKSTVTRRVAQALDLLYLDTGAMYRAVTWLVLEEKIPLDDEIAIAKILATTEIQLIATKYPEPIRVRINNRDVTQEIRTPLVTSFVSQISALASVRKSLVQEQQRWGENGGVIAEGRDIGTNVFPSADLKIFLTASIQERAERRWQDLKERGYKSLQVEEIEQDLQKRDDFDTNRSLAPLVKAEDAIEVSTDGLTIEEVTEKIIQLYREKQVL